MCVCVHACCSRRARERCESCSLHRNMQSPTQWVTPHQTTTRRVLSTRRNGPARTLPASRCPQPASRGDSVGWEGLAAPRSLPEGKLRARPVTSAGHRSSVAPQDASLLPCGCSRLKDPQPSQAREGRGSWSLSCPPAQPLLGWPQRSGRAAPVTSAFVSKHICCDTAWDHPCAQGEGCQPPASPSRGRGKGTSSLLDLGRAKPPKLREQFPTGGQQWGTVLGWAGRAAREAAGVRPSQPCSPAGLGRVQERLQSHKPDSSPTVTALGPLSGHLCSIFFAVSKTRNLSFK